MPILGTRGNVKRFTRDDLLGYIGKNYNVGSTVISIAGNIPFEKAEEIVRKYFVGRWSGGERDWRDRPRTPEAAEEYVFKDIEQSHITVTFDPCRIRARTIYP